MENISFNSFFEIATYSDGLKLMKCYLSKKDESFIEDIEDFIAFINNSEAILSE